MSETYSGNSERSLYSCILVCSEFGVDNAGSHRQERWVKEFLALYSDVFVMFPVGHLKIAEQKFISISDLEKFRHSIRRTLEPRKTSRTGIIARILRFLKYYFLLEFLLPINFILAFNLLFRLVSTRKVAVVHISSPPFPFSFYCTVIAASIRPKVKIHIDMRDPWATHHTLGGIKLLKLLLEKTIMRLAHTVTSATGFMADEFRSYHGIQAQVVYNVATHIEKPKQQTVRGDDEKLIDLTAATSSPVRIVYVGTMPEGFYDLKRLADWLVRLEIETEISKCYEWTFVGECDRLKAELDFRSCSQSRIRFSSRVAHEKAVEMMYNADILLFIGHQFPGYLTTKLFEYLAVEKNILPIFLSNDSEAYRLIADTCCGCPSIQTYEEFKKSIEYFHQLPKLSSGNSLHEMCAAYCRIAEDLLYGTEKYCTLHINEVSK